MPLLKPRVLPWQDTSVFLRVVRLAFRVDPVRSLKALLWIVRGKRVRGWRQLCTTAARNDDYYECWTLIAEPLLFEQHFSSTIPEHAHTSVFCIVVDGGGPASVITRTLNSVRRAFGDDVPLWAPNEGTQGGDRLEDHSTTIADVLGKAKASGARWVLPLKAGDTVSPFLCSALSALPDAKTAAQIIYWDEDVAAGERRRSPWVKPIWDELLYLARDCLSGSCALEVDSAFAAAEAMEHENVCPVAFSELILRIVASTRGAQTPRHLPMILTHRRGLEGFATPSQWKALVAKYWPGPVQVALRQPRTPYLKISPPEPARWPSVSIIIPTRDHAAVLGTCLASLEMIDYTGMTEILIVDNGSQEPDALDLLNRVEQSGFARILRRPEPFNYSALNNHAIELCQGELLCLLNNDIEARDGIWLKEMVAHAADPTIGAVGAQLLYPDGTIQHAGVVIGMGEAAGHVQKGVHPAAIEHAAWHSVTRTVSAVTAACLVVRRDHFLATGGLDEVGFAVAYNDVDLCLKLQHMGLRNIFVADAQLVHHESKSRGDDYAPQHSERFWREHALLQRRWRTSGFEDPHFSPLFSKVSEQCLLPF